MVVVAGPLHLSADTVRAIALGMLEVPASLLTEEAIVVVCKGRAYVWPVISGARS